MQYRLGSSDGANGKPIGGCPSQPQVKNTTSSPTWRVPRGSKYLVVSFPTKGLDCRRYPRVIGRVLRGSEADHNAILKRDDFSSNRHPALASLVEHDLFRKLVSTPHQVRGRLFRDHALGVQSCELILPVQLDTLRSP